METGFARHTGMRLAGAPRVAIDCHLEMVFNEYLMIINTNREERTISNAETPSGDGGKTQMIRTKAPRPGWTKILGRLQAASLADRGEDEFRLWQAASAEFVAVLLFIFLGCGAVVVTGEMTGGGMNVPRLILIAAVHGLGITALAYATINISGGHINPAVTITMLATRQISGIRALVYLGAQLGGAAVGGLLLLVVVPGASETTLGSHSLGAGVAPWAGVLTEAILTFGLVFVIFTTAVNSRELRNFAPIAIGLAVFVTNVFGIPISGASLNPARSFGPAVVAWEWADHWVYWAGPVAGGVIAGWASRWAFQPRRV